MTTGPLVPKFEPSAGRTPHMVGFVLRGGSPPVHDGKIEEHHVTDDELIEAAAAVLNPRSIGGRLMANVGAALVTDLGDMFQGVCIDTPCGTGFCAEASAIAAMVTAGQQHIETIVAVWDDPETGRRHVLPPCGRCRLFISQMDPANLGTRVVLGRTVSQSLEALLPGHQWPDPLD